MSNRLRKSESDSQFDVGAGRFQPRHLRQPHGHLPQVIERGQVDAPARRELALEAGQQRLARRARCGRADRRSTASQRPGRGRLDAARRRAVDVADLEADVGVARARPLDHLGQVVDARAARVGQRRQQVALAAARPPAPTRRPGSGARAPRSDRGAGSRAPPGGAAPRARAPVVLAPGGVQRVRQRRRRRARRRARRRLTSDSMSASRWTPSASCSLLGRQRVALLEVLPGRTLMLSVWSICMSGRLKASLCLPQGTL